MNKRKASIWDLRGCSQTIKKACVATYPEEAERINGEMGMDLLSPDPDGQFATGETSDPLKIELLLTLIPKNAAEAWHEVDSPTEGRGVSFPLSQLGAAVFVWKTEGREDVDFGNEFPFYDLLGSSCCTAMATDAQGDPIGRPFSGGVLRDMFDMWDWSTKPVMTLDYGRKAAVIILPFAVPEDKLSQIPEEYAANPPSYVGIMISPGADAFYKDLARWISDCILR